MIHGQRRVYGLGGDTRLIELSQETQEHRNTGRKKETQETGKKETQEHRKQKRRVSGYWAGRGHTTYRAFTGNKIRSRDKTLVGRKEM